MNLSERMKANCRLVPQAECLADVGTDHGYVPIFLVKEGRVKRALAMDVNRGPLLRAEENIRQEGLSGRISVRLSDGLSGLRAGEADVILIAGMGGPLTIRILEMGEEKLQKEKQQVPDKDQPDAAGAQPDRPGVRALVLQPQSEIPEVRRFLMDRGWIIHREDMVLEEGKFYPMMEAERGREDLDPLQLAFGPRLLEQKHPVLLEYLKHEEKTLEKVLKSLEKASGGRREERLSEVKDKLILNRQAQVRIG